MNPIRLTVALLALTATTCAQATGAEVALVGLGMTAAAAAFTATVLQATVVLYGLYKAKTARNKARRAADGGIEDRRSSVGSTDMARSIVYGERQVDGRVMFISEAREDRPGLLPGEEPKFYIVKALEPDHEVDRIVDIQFDGRPVGPFQTDPNDVEGGVPVGPGSFYYKQSFGSATYDGIVPSWGVIDIPGRSVTKVLSLLVGDAAFDDPGRPNDEPAPIFTSLPEGSRAISLGGVVVGTQFSGKHFRLTYQYEINQPLVRVWFYRGTQEQKACRKIMEVSGGTVSLESTDIVNDGGVWTSRARLRGTPYVVVEITPDFEKFPSMQPYITATVKGKRGLLVHGGTGWSRNPADHIYDYLRTEIGVREDEINMDLLEAAHTACADEVISHYDYNNIKKGEGASDQLPIPVSEPRYACDAVLSTEVRMVDNLRYLLASMAGSCVYSGGRFDIRAGVAEVSDVTLTAADLGPGGVQVDPFTPYLESFNAVRGRHTRRKRIYSEQGGIFLGDEAYSYTTTDYPPYKSQFYINQDQGEVNWEEVDLPCVTSEYQAQRIAKLLLHLNRNGLMFTAEWRMSAARFSAGEVVNVSLPASGFVQKPFRIMSKESDAKTGLIRMTMKEEPAAVYNFSFDEAEDPDPAPNTKLTPVDEVEAPQSISIDSSAAVARYGLDGSVVPIARVTWDRPASYGILYGGQVEVWYKFGQDINWQKQSLPGNTEFLEVPVLRGLDIVGQIRFINAVQAPGPFAQFSKRLTDVPTQYLVGNLLVNARFESFTQTSRPDPNYPAYLWYIPGWFGVTGSSPNGFPIPGVGDVMPFPYAIKKGDPGRLGAFDTGIMSWADFHGSNYRTQWVESQAIEVQGTSRLVAFAHVWGQHGYVSISVVEYEPSGDYVREHESERVMFTAAGVAGIDRMRQVGVFVNLTRYGDSPTTRVRLRLNHYRHPGMPDNFVTAANFARPYLGYASEGQVTRPAWSS